MEATIQSKMRLDKCNVYAAKEILGYRGRKSEESAEEWWVHEKSEPRKWRKGQWHYRKETEEATDKEKIGEGEIRKRRAQEEIATKPKISEDKDKKEKVEQRNRTEERNIKLRNTFSVLQEDNQEPILEEELYPITKIDKKEKKEIKGKEEGNCEYLNEKREIVKWNSNQDYQKKHINKWTQTKKKDPIRCKSGKCYNDCFIYKTTECLK